MQQINDQHDEIFNNFDVLIKSYEKHILYENKFLNIRNKIKPDFHLNVEELIKKHMKEHYQFLDKLNKLKIDLENHIKLYDKKQLHKL